MLTSSTQNGTTIAIQAKLVMTNSSIIQLALDGHSGQAIAAKVGLPKRTVNHWLHELRQEWIARAAEGGGEMFAFALARLDAIYREAMEAWRDSQGEMEVRLVEDTQVADGSRAAKQRRSVRTQPQRRNAALLSKATAAVMATCRLKGCAAPARAEVAEPSAATIPLETLTEDILGNMSTDDLRVVAARLRAAIEAGGGSIPAELDRDLEHMTWDELQAYHARLTAEIEAIAAANAPTRAAESACQQTP